jgi:Uma2 family endonuclease
VSAGDNSTVMLDMENEHQPDDVLLIESGQTAIEDGYIVGAPEWAGEISASTVDTDLGPKFEAYRRNGVQEYVVWRVLDREIDWFRLRGDKYDRLLADATGIIRSEVMPGLWLDVSALIQGNLVRVHEVLHQGLQSPEHQQFVARLKKSP